MEKLRVDRFNLRMPSSLVFFQNAIWQPYYGKQIHCGFSSPDGLISLKPAWYTLMGYHREYDRLVLSFEGDDGAKWKAHCNLDLEIVTSGDYDIEKIRKASIHISVGDEEKLVMPLLIHTQVEIRHPKYTETALALDLSKLATGDSIELMYMDLPLYRTLEPKSGYIQARFKVDKKDGDKVTLTSTTVEPKIILEFQVDENGARLIMRKTPSAVFLASNKPYICFPVCHHDRLGRETMFKDWLDIKLLDRQPLFKTTTPVGQLFFEMLNTFRYGYHSIYYN